ncbi:MAG: hypothetical protein M1834_007179 [Cirrosporium novae-zelandiae]|nr:MAG: hypothetical protein M1834_007179 [Cirrosporium novae-zelandiae]
MSHPTPTYASGVSPPFEVITDTDRRGLIAIMTSMSICLVLLSFGIRVYLRTSTIRWRVDDSVLTMSAIVYFIQSGVVYYAMDKGLGETLEDIPSQNLVKLQKAEYAADILFAFNGQHIPRQSDQYHYRDMHSMQLGATILILGPIGTKRNAQWTRRQVIGALNIITEAMLFAISIYLVADLQMAWKAKSVVVAAFGSRILVIIICAFRIYYYKEQMYSTDTTLAATYATVCSQLELGYGIMSNTIPSLRPFMAAYEDPNRSAKMSGYGYNLSTFSSTKNDTAAMAAKRRSRNRPASQQPPKQEPPVPQQAIFRPDQAMYGAAVSHDDVLTHGHNHGHGHGHGHSHIHTHGHRHAKDDDDDRQSIGSNDSQRMIIQKTVDWSIESEAETRKLRSASAATTTHLSDSIISEHSK